MTFAEQLGLLPLMLSSEITKSASSSPWPHHQTERTEKRKGHTLENVPLNELSLLNIILKVLFHLKKSHTHFKIVKNCEHKNTRFL